MKENNERAAVKTQHKPMKEILVKTQAEYEENEAAALRKQLR